MSAPEGGNVTPLFGTSQRLPPSNVQAEQALLGAILASPKAYGRVEHFLKPEHFVDPVNARIYKAIVKRLTLGLLADVITLRNDFHNDGVLDEVGGMPYLAQIQAAMVTPIVAGEYGRAVHDSWVRRQLIEVGEALVHRSFVSDDDTEAVMQDAVGQIEKFLAGEASQRRGFTLNEAMDKAMLLADQARSGGGVVGLSTGMPSVDKVLGGLEPGTLNILAGRPGSGKSSLGQQWAIHAARRGAFVVEFSLEMSAAALGRRVLSAASGVPIWRMRRGEHGDFASDLINARRVLHDLPLVIHDGGRMSAPEITTKCRVEARKKPIGLIVVDHLHLVRADDGAARHGPTAAVTETVDTMLGIAKQFGCPVLLLSQLSRAPEGRDDHRPTTSDLRQSGAIEQNADTIAFVYRAEQYISRADPVKTSNQTAETYANECSKRAAERLGAAGQAELLCEKVRDGEPGTVKLQFEGPTASFRDPSL